MPSVPSAEPDDRDGRPAASEFDGEATTNWRAITAEESYDFFTEYLIDPRLDGKINSTQCGMFGILRAQIWQRE